MKLYEINSLKKFSFSCVYKWENLVNGKIYVGVASNFYVRMAKYKQGYFNKYMKPEIEEYGLKNFEISIIEKNILPEEKDEKEKYWIAFYAATDRDKGYNIAEYGSHLIGCETWNKGKHISSQEKEAISNGLKEYYSNHEVWNKGIPQSEEAKQKNREANSGENNGMYGKHHSLETKEKIRKSLTGRKLSDERKEKVSKKVRCVETGKVYSSITEAAKEFNCHFSAISNVVRGKTKTSKGYHWVYET